MGTQPDLFDRIYGSLAGLALGDALGFPAMYHRTLLGRPKSRARLRIWTEVGDQHNVIVTQMPYTIARNPRVLDVCPTDDTEWALFSAQILLRYGSTPTAQQYQQAWQEEVVVRETSVRSGVSERAAIENFKRGLLPPTTGNDNPHHYDDGAVRRAVPIGLVHPGDPATATTVAERDASVTSAEDGVWAAQAMAAALAEGVSGAEIPRMIEAARRFMPEGSWLAYNTARALELVPRGTSPADALVILHDQFLSRIYNYPNVAPETVALALALLSMELGSVQEALLIANAFHRAAESMPAWVGALYGVVYGASTIPASWLGSTDRCKGICLPQMAGVSVKDVATELAGLARRQD
ncbi:ADP-ribosylglycohydrolase family protein [Limnochorda pilosa]|uniref:ADP-ribosylglycohydrolase family protein n=1 Tax=Limnochorda pilosa TaxID=1555112 RepID=UPI00082BDB89|nr:ADP-ribosylglycohydrolase family protein [Limnochorda pilosa]